MGKRDHIPLKVQLAAALLQLRDESGELLIPYSDARQLTAEQIISLFHRDHWPIPKALGGEDVPWNIHWRFIAEHREKTRKVDIPTIAKVARLERSAVEFRAKVLAKFTSRPKIESPKRKIPQRANPWPKRKNGRSTAF